MDFVLIFWLLILAAVCAVVWFFCSGSRTALTTVFFFACAALVRAGFWNCILRDGLGPDSVTSTGLKAWRRFASDMLFPVGICGLIIVIAGGFFVWRHRRTRDARS
jgi:hypothetical protein